MVNVMVVRVLYIYISYLCAWFERLGSLIPI